MSGLRTMVIAGALSLLAPQLAGASTFTTLYSFTGQADGARPWSPLLFYRGAFYGTTDGGGIRKNGSPGYGTLYKFDPATGAVTPIYTFKGKPDASVLTGTITAHDGKIYGTSYYGGSSDIGAVFGIALGSGNETFLYSFAGGTDGQRPNAGLTFANGLLFGTTSKGGNQEACTNGCGTVYTIDPVSNLESIVHTFAYYDGNAPEGDLILLNGKLQGTTISGGTQYGGDGTIFSLDPTDDSFKLNYSFTQKDGPNPVSLTPVGKVLYGTELSGNPNGGVGSLFAFNQTTSRGKSLYRFQGKQDGCYPYGAMVKLNGLLYGVTLGNSYSQGHKNIVLPGSIFSLDPRTKVETTVYTFPSDNASFGLTVLNGKLYGATSGLGANNLGSIFSFVP